MKRKPWQKNLDLLTPKQLARYEDSLEVLRLMRNGSTFSMSTKTVGANPSTVKKILGRTLTKRNNRIKARKNDLLIRKLRIYENGKEVFIQVKGNKKAKLVAQYHSAVGREFEGIKSLQSFENTRIVDIFRKSHTFETNIDSIQLIFEKREEPEFFTIYRSQ